MSIQDKLSSNKLDLSDSSTFRGKDNSKNNLEPLYLTNLSLDLYPATYPMLKSKEISQILIGELDRLKQKHFTKKEKVL